MADLSTTPLPPPPLSPPLPRPPVPPPVAPVVPPKPPVLPPPSSIPVKDTDLSHLTPSPAPFTPASLPPAPKPTSLPPLPPVTSTVRTMASDIALLQKGSPPVAMAPKPILKPSLPPRPIVPTPPSTHRSPIVPPVKIPPQSEGSKMPLIIGILIVLVIGAVAWWWFGFRDSEPAPTATPSEIPTPTPTPTPTATPTPTFTDIFRPQAVLADLDQAINAEVLSIGEIKFYAPKSQKDLGITIPPSVLSALDDQFFVTLFGKPDGTKGRGFAIKVKDQSAAQIALTTWETSMSSNLKTLLQINIAKAASVKFLDGQYHNVVIRYRNFPDAWKTIDYAIVTMPNQEPYFIVTNTRDHIFGIIDKAVGPSFGK